VLVSFGRSPENERGDGRLGRGVKRLGGWIGHTDRKKVVNRKLPLSLVRGKEGEVGGELFRDGAGGRGWEGGVGGLSPFGSCQAG